MWSAIDQILSSGTNVALGLVVARLVSATEFGAFSVAFVAYTVALGLVTAGVSEPLVVRYSASVAIDRIQAFASATGASLLFGTGVGVALAVGGLIVGGTTGQCLIALGVLLPGLLTHDVTRYLYFASGMPQKAAAIDGVWAAGQAVAYVAISFTVRDPQPELLLSAWGASAWLAAGFALIELRIRPLPRSTVAWWRSHRRVALPFAGDFIMRSGASQIVLVGTAAVAGLRAVGTLRAALLLMSPLSLAAAGLRIVALPEGSRIRASTPRQIMPTAIGLGAVLVLVGVAWAGLLVIAPHAVGRSLVGESWDGARAVLLPIAVVSIAGTAAAPALFGLRVLTDGRRLVRARWIDATTTITASLFGAAIDGGRGAAVGWAAANLAVASVWWQQFGRAYKASVSGLPRLSPLQRAVSRYRSGIAKDV